MQIFAQMDISENLFNLLNHSQSDLFAHSSIDQDRRRAENAPWWKMRPFIGTRVLDTVTFI